MYKNVIVIISLLSKNLVKYSILLFFLKTSDFIYSSTTFNIALVCWIFTATCLTVEFFIFILYVLTLVWLVLPESEACLSSILGNFIYFHFEYVPCGLYLFSDRETYVRSRWDWFYLPCLLNFYSYLYFFISLWRILI